MKLFMIIKQNRGLTIIELLIALVILIIVISLGYMFNFYVVRSFEIASNQSSVQQNVRIAKSIIENNVRYSEVELLDALPGGREEKYQIIYVDDNGFIKHVDEDGNVSDLLGTISSGINMQLSFENKGNSFLWINVQGDIDGSYVYNIGSEILIQKVTDADDTITGDSGSVIYFYTPKEE